jgi:hypothetical protein
LPSGQLSSGPSYCRFSPDARAGFRWTDRVGIRNVAALILVVAGLAVPIMLIQWAILFFTYFPYRAAHPTFSSLLQWELILRWAQCNDVSRGDVAVSLHQEKAKVTLSPTAQPSRSAGMTRPQTSQVSKARP